jgi:hypothetical protein
MRRIAFRRQAGSASTRESRRAKSWWTAWHASLGREDAAHLDGYEARCRPVAQANAHESFENMKRLGEIARVLGESRDLAALEERLGSLTEAERRGLDDAIEAQRSHFLSDGAPLERAMVPEAKGDARVGRDAR